MHRSLAATAASLYRLAVPQRARNSLRLALMLDDRDRPPRLVESFPERRVLVLAPHMDDEIAGCGGTLRRHVEAGAAIAVVYLTDGSQGSRAVRMLPAGSPERRRAEQELRRRREAEARAACRTVGIGDLRFLGAPDGALRPTPALIDALSAIFAEWAPQLVYHPSLFDLHEDHWQTNCLAAACFRSGRPPCAAPRWRGYEVWTPLLANAVVDITGTVELKREAFAAFASQNEEIEYPRAVLAL